MHRALATFLEIPIPGGEDYTHIQDVVDVHYPQLMESLIHGVRAGGQLGVSPFDPPDLQRSVKKHDLDHHAPISASSTVIARLKNSHPEYDFVEHGGELVMDVSIRPDPSEAFAPDDDPFFAASAALEAGMGEMVPTSWLHQVNQDFERSSGDNQFEAYATWENPELDD